MYRSKGDMASPRPHHFIVLVALCFFASCSAGPLPNVTIADIGLKEGACAVGDVVYLPGEDVPGAGACERCKCREGSVSCSRMRCEPRPGCKALHRPDHCCPTYQCECEQEGRVYGNGEKLVDPQDPCRVCYCQGGEVVCRRIACFLRDDCTPRLVPGRCCPEYDNCPLRGVTTVPGVTPSISTVEESASSPAPTPPREHIKQEITIKEITPVSEIPVLPEVKVKEVAPTPGFEVPHYSSSKSPLIVREATSESPFTTPAESATEKPVVIETQPSSSSALPPLPTETLTSPPKSAENNEVTKDTNDSPPSKISLSTQDYINSEMYPSIFTIFATMGSPSISPEPAPAAGTSKPLVVEEEDPALFEHNPAFPPLPDDLSVLSNHEDELMPEPGDSDHGLAHETTGEPNQLHEKIDTSPIIHTVFIVPSSTPLDTVTVHSKAIPETTPEVPIVVTETSTYASTNSNLSTSKSAANSATSPTTTSELSAVQEETTASSETTRVKDSPMLNLRSAIPTEILDIPSSVPEDINGAEDDVTDSTAAASETVTTVTFLPTKNTIKEVEKLTEIPKAPTPASAPTAITETKMIATKASNIAAYTTIMPQFSEQTASSDAKSNTATEITGQTEFSSLPIETSDQNPKENSDNIERELLLASTVNPSSVDFTTTRVSTPIETEVITVSRSAPSTGDTSGENVETTEFIITAYGSSETATDAVELIKISAEPEKSAAIIEPAQKKKNSVLTDLINLVGDVAAIGNHTDSPEVHFPPSSSVLATTGISESEELIPVNAGYKSKNSNWNLNSITEIPLKSKGSPVGSKQKVIEIEDEEAESITDSPAPNDKVEPTTRRPVIDNVSDTRPSSGNNNNTDKKDIEIITKSYVPTINRRPTKVVMKKNNEQPVTEQEPVSAETEQLPSSTTASGVTTPPPVSETTPSPPVSDVTTAPVFTSSPPANDVTIAPAVKLLPPASYATAASVVTLLPSASDVTIAPAAKPLPTATPSPPATNVTTAPSVKPSPPASDVTAAPAVTTADPATTPTH